MTSEWPTAVGSTSDQPTDRFTQPTELRTGSSQATVVRPPFDESLVGDPGADGWASEDTVVFAPGGGRPIRSHRRDEPRRRAAVRLLLAAAISGSGIAIAIAHELGIPVKLIGVGEGLDDLRPFDPRQFCEALLGE